MRDHVLTSLLAAAAIAGLGAVMRVTAWPLVAVDVAPAVSGEPAAMVMPVGSPASDSLAATVSRRNPFRVSRSPAPVAYDPVRALEPEPPPVPRPVLSLVGIVWDGGTEPSAVIEGLPGVEGARAVRSGEVIGAVRVAAIGRKEVRLVGMDTVWTLTVREPWKPQ